MAAPVERSPVPAGVRSFSDTPSTLRVCVLGSGSSGNATVVCSPDTAVLIDAGLSAKRIQDRLLEMGLSADRLAGVCISHEHHDHVCGLRVLHRRHGMPLYANAGAIDYLSKKPELEALRWNQFTPGHAFPVGSLHIEPFSVPHDAYDPVGFIITHRGARVGIVTDMGTVTELIRERLRSCHALVIESNHDEQMLRNSSRPWPLIQRILGRQGHLSNHAAATLISDIAGPHLQHVYLAHLSEDCNCPRLAQTTVEDALRQTGFTHINIHLTYPNQPSAISLLPALV